jgi:hypothetical protein
MQRWRVSNACSGGDIGPPVGPRVRLDAGIAVHAATGLVAAGGSAGQVCLFAHGAEGGMPQEPTHLITPAASPPISALRFLPAGWTSTACSPAAPSSTLLAVTTLGNGAAPGELLLLRCCGDGLLRGSVDPPAGTTPWLAGVYSAGRSSLWDVAWLEPTLLAAAASSTGATVMLRLRPEGGLVREGRLFGPSDALAVCAGAPSMDASSCGGGHSLAWVGRRSGGVEGWDGRTKSPSGCVSLTRADTSVAHLHALHWPYLVVADSSTGLSVRDVRMARSGASHARGIASAAVAGGQSPSRRPSTASGSERSRGAGDTVARMAGYCNSHHRLGTAVDVSCRYVAAAGSDGRVRVWQVGGRGGDGGGGFAAAAGHSRAAAIGLVAPCIVLPAAGAPTASNAILPLFVSDMPPDCVLDGGDVGVVRPWHVAFSDDDAGDSCSDGASWPLLAGAGTAWLTSEGTDYRDDGEAAGRGRCSAAKRYAHAWPTLFGAAGTTILRYG